MHGLKKNKNGMKNHERIFNLKTKIKMKRITQKRLTEFINQVSEVKPSTIPEDNAMCYYSKIDGSYFGREGMERDIKFLLKKGITEQLQNAHNVEDHTVNVGFNREENKWYGWSHRAIYGFGIGSECKKGHCGYTPSTPEDLFKNVTEKDKDGWQWHEPENVELMEDGVRIKVGMVKQRGNQEPLTSKNIADKCDVIMDTEGKTIDYEPCEPDYFEIKCGRGEWKAKNLDDAKQMAIDFADGIG